MSPARGAPPAPPAAAGSPACSAPPSPLSAAEGSLRVPAPGGRDHAHVELALGLGPERPHALRLERAQQRSLLRQRQLADLVEHQHTAVRLLERAAAPALGARERAALVAEELGLEQAVGDGRTVHGHERAAAARTQLGDSARKQLLADARLARDQERQVTVEGSVHPS